MSGGSGSTAEKYAKFGAGEYSSSDFESYVDSRPDLAAAWSKIESDPTAWDSKYWIDKGATSKSAFGRAHAAEDAELYAGTYGAGGTKVVPGSPEYDAYFGDSGGTYFDSFISGASGEGEGGGGGSSRIGPGNPYYPQRVQEFTPRTAQDWSAYMPAGSPLAVNKGILYQADINSQGIPDSIWNYQPPMLYASGGGGGGLSMGTGGGGHFIPTGMLSVGSHSPSSSSSSVPVGSDDPRNIENRGGPDRPDGGGGADTDTQTRHDPTKRSNPGGASYPTTTPAHYPTDLHPPVPTKTYPNTPPPGYTPAPSYPNTPPPGLVAAQERAKTLANASDYAREEAEKALSREMAGWIGLIANQPGYVAMPAGLAPNPQRLAQEIEMDLGYFAGLTGAGSSSGGSSHGGDPSGDNDGGAGGPSGGGHSRR